MNSKIKNKIKQRFDQKDLTKKILFEQTVTVWTTKYIKNLNLKSFPLILKYFLNFP